MGLVKHDHYYGYYSGEHVKNLYNCSDEIILENSNSIAQFYRSKRKQFLELLSEINEEYRLSIIDEEMKNYFDILANNSPETFQLLLDKKLLEKMESSYVHEDKNLLIGSYLYFLKIVEDKYKRIEKIKSIEIKWLSDYNRFIEFYQILNNANIIDCDFLRFKQFFSLKVNLKYNSNLYETSAIFYELVENQYITELTLDAMIENHQIVATNGKKKETKTLERQNYIQSKSKYNDEFSDNKIREEVYIALNKFGITLKQKI
ncbi:MAG: hypothetical protein RO257_03885 [Candidatus Kapabacteria bacterium]|nr:hypothetical protein [Candidatus Kapabacteria bacterium]